MHHEMNAVLPMPWPDRIARRSSTANRFSASSCQGRGCTPRTSVTNRSGFGREFSHACSHPVFSIATLLLNES